MTRACRAFEETETGETFSLQNERLLKVELADATIQAKPGSMVAYQGEVKFEHAGSGGLSRHDEEDGHRRGHEADEADRAPARCSSPTTPRRSIWSSSTTTASRSTATTCSPSRPGIEWDIRKVEGASGAMAGGLFNLELSGSGSVALLSHGPPLLLELDGTPTFADPQAAITWSSGVRPRSRPTWASRR